MSHPVENDKLWRWPAFLLWLLFFAMGFIPEYVFLFLREMGHVVTQRAIVNSEYVITASFAGYAAFFTYYRCVEAGRGPRAARSIALQVFCTAFVAFLPMLRINLEWGDVLGRDVVAVVILLTLLKWIAWLYLYVIVIRYYFFDGQHVFARMRPLLPSARAEEAKAKQQQAECSAENTDG